MNKIFTSATEAIHDIQDGASIMFGGFGLCGIPENLISAIHQKNLKKLTCISSNAGVADFGVGILLNNHQVKKMISSYVGENEEFEKQIIEKSIEVELVPQGTFAERIRAAGAGIPGFYTRTGVGTEVENFKEKKNFNGKDYLLETALSADFACIKAWKGDAAGNLIFKGTARNFNPMMATAGKITIAEVEELVPIGTLDPNEIHVPGIYIQRIFQGSNYEKRIEHLTTRTEETVFNPSLEQFSGAELDRNKIAKRIAQEIKDGDYVNLGIGIPTLVANFIDPIRPVMFQSENGLLGIGQFPKPDEVDPDLINASKQTITFHQGSSLFSSADSFAMIRGGHIHVTVLGAMEVAQNGDLANWKIPGKMIKGMGGAMDLVASASNVIVAMQHTNKEGKSKLLKSCTLPLTGIGCVHKIVTELAVIEIVPEGFKLLERAKGVSVEHIKNCTEGNLIVEGEIPTF
ncbi:MAG: 3-oxoacid CoA-transferase subunit B [Aquirufa sp.]